MKNQMKLIASDFDGTIGTGERLLKDQKAIEEFRKKGNAFFLVSGRNSPALKAVRERAELPCDYLMSNSGATCFGRDEKGNFEKLLFTDEMEGKLLFPLLEFLLQRESRLLAVSRTNSCDTYYYRDPEGKIHIPVDRSTWKEEPFTQVSGYFMTEEHCREVAAEINEKFPEVNAYPNGDCIDIPRKGVSKALGIAKLAELLSVEKENVYAVGDNYNDIPMLDAYNSFVVANGPREVQKHGSKGVVKGVYEMISRILQEEENT